MVEVCLAEACKAESLSMEQTELKSYVSQKLQNIDGYSVFYDVF